MNARRHLTAAVAMAIASCSLSSDPESGAEAVACAPGTKPCGGQCVSVLDPSHGCGSESCEPCPAPEHLAPLCVAGACAFGPCDEGWGDCDDRAESGCETDLTTAVDHCGSCVSSCLQAHTLADETSCASGECVLGCAEGYADCNLDPADGCEAELAADHDHCSACGEPCGEDEICQQGECVKDDPTLAWLATRQGGWCLDDYEKLINLCGKVSSCSFTLCGDLDDEAPETGDPTTSPNCYPDLGHEHDRAVPFCCDPAYFRTYDEGIGIDVGLHYDGLSTGWLLSMGGDYPGNALYLDLREPGLLEAAALGSETLTTPLASGTHLVSVRLTTSQIALHIDGVLVAVGAGAADPKDMEAAYGPGFVLGSRMSYWWEEPTTLRFAPFFFHLRDAVADPSEFSLAEATEPGTRTVVLFDEQGATGNAWDATSGAGTGYAISKELGGEDGAWDADVWGTCL